MWLELMLLMVYGPGRVTGDGRVDVPDPSVHGVIRSAGGGDLPGNSMGWFASSPAGRPVMTGSDLPEGATDARAWRDGDRVRVEAADGSPTFITDGTTTWTFDEFAGDGVPSASTGHPVSFVGYGTHLLARRDPMDFLGDDFTRPTGPARAVTHLGRPAWEVELAPPPHKPYPLRLVVDAATGLVLEQRVEAVGAVDAWTELSMGDPLDPSLFTWTGLVRSPEEERATGLAEHEAERAAGATWWDRYVGQRRQGVTVEADLDLSLTWVHEHDDDGSFHASLGGDEQNVSLARRPRSSTPWNLHWWGNPTPHRWSTQRWDWAFHWHEQALTGQGYAAVERCFPDEPGQGAEVQNTTGA